MPQLNIALIIEVSSLTMYFTFIFLGLGFIEFIGDDVKLYNQTVFLI